MQSRSLSSRSNTLSIEKLEEALGYFSLALGALECAAPGKLNRWLGIRGYEKVTQFFGFREVVAGIGLLAQKNPSWFWFRAIGDGLDLATLLISPASRSKRTNRALAVAMVAGVTAVDVLAARASSSSPQKTVTPLGKTKLSVIINASPSEVVERWNEFPELARFNASFENTNRGTLIKIKSRRAEDREKLRRFKQLVETGEILRTEGQPSGRSESTSWKFDRYAA